MELLEWGRSASEGRMFLRSSASAANRLKGQCLAGHLFYAYASGHVACFSHNTGYCDAHLTRDMDPVCDLM